MNDFVNRFQAAKAAYSRPSLQPKRVTLTEPVRRAPVAEEPVRPAPVQAAPAAAAPAKRSKYLMDMVPASMRSNAPTTPSWYVNGVAQPGSYSPEAVRALSAPKPHVEYQGGFSGNTAGQHGGLQTKGMRGGVAMDGASGGSTGGLLGGYTGLRDMVNGGGPGASGSTFSGGGAVSRGLNAAGVSPVGSRNTSSGTKTTTTTKK